MRQAINFLKEHWIEWFAIIFFAVNLVVNWTVAEFSKNVLIYNFTNSIPFFLIILAIIYGEILYGIEENLWGEFKEGKDIHIDRMMKKLNKVFIILVICCFVWFFLIAYNLLFIENYVHYTSLFLTPLFIIIALSKNYQSMYKDYTR